MSFETVATIGKGVVIRESSIPGSGNGLWTARPFFRNDLITEYCGPIIDHEKALKLRKRGRHTHVRVLNSQWLYIDGLKAPVPGEGGASFANDARDAAINNAAFVQRFDRKLGRDRVFLKATRDLARDEEVFVSYGNTYWQTSKLQAKPVANQQQRQRQQRQQRHPWQQQQQQEETSPPQRRSARQQQQQQVQQPQAQQLLHKVSNPACSKQPRGRSGNPASLQQQQQQQHSQDSINTVQQVESRQPVSHLPSRPVIMQEQHQAELQLVELARAKRQQQQQEEEELAWAKQQQQQELARAERQQQEELSGAKQQQQVLDGSQESVSSQVGCRRSARVCSRIKQQQQQQQQEIEVQAAGMSVDSGGSSGSQADGLNWGQKRKRSMRYQDSLVKRKAGSTAAGVVPGSAPAAAYPVALASTALAKRLVAATGAPVYNAVLEVASYAAASISKLRRRASSGV